MEKNLVQVMWLGGEGITASERNDREVIIQALDHDMDPRPHFWTSDPYHCSYIYSHTRGTISFPDFHRNLLGVCQFVESLPFVLRIPLLAFLLFRLLGLWLEIMNVLYSVGRIRSCLSSAEKVPASFSKITVCTSPATL